MSNEENEQIQQRRSKLAAWREQGNAFPNTFRRTHWAAEIHERFGELDAETLDAEPQRVRVAGRMVAKRVMGKASFAHIGDGSDGQIQLFVTRDALPEGEYNAGFKKWDVGDIVGASGVLFRTKTGELTVSVDEVQLLTKSLRPLPEKWHGLTDDEARLRQRYVDLIVNRETRETFRIRSSMISAIRRYLLNRDYLEVETPMMQPIPGGATARPFVTHHNALDMDLYLRVAPELYLKRLVVGGFERVFEINRNFRNEGVSTRHNPEFTMLEFYQAYAGFQDLMDLIEEMTREAALAVLGTPVLTHQGKHFDLGQAYRRLTIEEAVLEHNEGLSAAELREPVALRQYLTGLGVEPDEELGWGGLLVEIFEQTVEDRLVEPTFITHYPTEVSPLARRNDDDPEVVDRFELFFGGREVGNGFSELNDPEDQAARFKEQAEKKAGGDDEAMHYDADYIRALEYGMPPAAGAGLGIDRMAMVFADQDSIREVILFPHMRPSDRDE
ncbi:lysine--tRNA ligase [Thiohalorhabdus methylotrophus]|uniref:Lysine--tRNA ligase n=1 Tax=Thiohalorhabdus methylotrophus TaxID=3242694 RepID=A0ABV4TWD6_9GAMM